MTPAANGLLSLILIALGIVAIILSFLVPDRKKSLISLGLGGLIILSGLIQFGSQSFAERRWKKRLEELRQERQVDVDKWREDFKKKTDTKAPK